MKRVVIFGGNGFVGREIVTHLKNFDTKVVCRNPKKKNEISGDITKKETLEKIIKKGDIIINLVGLTPLRKPNKTTYREVHVEGVKNLISICKKKNCKLIHMSALGAHINAKTQYLRTKGEAEKLIINSKLKNYNIFCPSIIYDFESEIIKMFDKSLKFRSFPNIPALVQPVYRKDIAKLFLLAVKNKIKEHKIEVGGPEKMKLFIMAKRYFQVKRKICIPIPLWTVKIGIHLGILLKLKGLTKDNITSLHLDNTTNVKQKYIKLKNYENWINTKEVN